MIRTSFKTSLRCSAALAVTLAAGFGQAAFAQQTQLAAAAATEASVDEIAATPGIGGKIASVIESYLEGISAQKVNTETGEISDN